MLKSELVAGLSSLSGQWAFVLHDRKRHRVVAAASKDGSVGLQWGCAPQRRLRESNSFCTSNVLTPPRALARLSSLRSETIKNVLMFTTTPDSAIDETEPSPFPAGCVFISSGAKVKRLSCASA